MRANVYDAWLLLLGLAAVPENRVLPRSQPSGESLPNQARCTGNERSTSPSSRWRSLGIQLCDERVYGAGQRRRFIDRQKVTAARDNLQA